MELFPYDFSSCKRRHQHVFTINLFMLSDALFCCKSRNIYSSGKAIWIIFFLRLTFFNPKRFFFRPYLCSYIFL